MRAPNVRSRRHELGQTLLVTAVAMVAMLSMAVLAIDVVFLYVSSSEAQKAADAGALAGAKGFVSSGFTSGQLGDPTTAAAQNQVCDGSAGVSDLQAQAAARQNLIAGGLPTTITTSCTFSAAENPQITVVVTKIGLPSFFARIWGAGANSVRSTAKAEAYNPSGSNTFPIQVKNVKPWLIANCDPTMTPPCPTSPYYVDYRLNYAIPNPSFYIGQYLTFKQIKNPTPGGYYAITLPQATVCPSPSRPPGGSCDEVSSGFVYHDNIACFNSSTLTCGSTVSVDPNNATGAERTKTLEGTQCLMHTQANGNPQNSCNVDLAPDCFVSGPPVTINGGQSNPNPSMQVQNISRSDSVVTLPLFDFTTPGDNPCPGGVCGTKTVPVIGFMQFGIQSISPTGVIKGFVLNVAGCDPASSGNALTGGGISPIPVRLVK